MLSLLALVLTPAPETPEPPEIPNVIDMSEDRAPEVEVLDPHEEHAQILEAAEKVEEERRAAEAEKEEQEAAEEAAAQEVEVASEVAEPAPAPEHTHERTVWDRLADCESGEWVNGGASFVEGSARWSYGIDFVHEGYEQFQGGLNFAAGTWQSYKDPGMPDHAGNATREQQIVVGERVQADQGWAAWPRCASMIGLR